MTLKQQITNLYNQYNNLYYYPISSVNPLVPDKNTSPSLPANINLNDFIISLVLIFYAFI